VKHVRSIGIFAGIVAVAVSSVLATSIQGASASANRHHHTGHHAHVRHNAKGFSWAMHDRAVYAVSTLNAPLCGGKTQLSAQLWKQYSARYFDVLASSDVRGLFFIQVKTVAGTILGVYEYQFGSRLPMGIQTSHCVASAPSSASAAYRSKNWTFIARFGSTYPKS